MFKLKLNNQNIKLVTLPFGGSVTRTSPSSWEMLVYTILSFQSNGQVSLELQGLADNVMFKTIGF